MVTNWAGNFTYSSYPLQQASSVEEIQAYVKKYERLKVLGTRHCFNDIADSKDQLISLAGFDKITGLDAVGQTVTVEAGVRYGELAVWLEQRGYALHNLASLPHISVVGGCMTATHGSGTGNANLSSAVRALEWVTAGGELVSLSLNEDPEHFRGAVVSLGALGIITRITLAIEPSYQVRQTVYRDLPIGQLEGHFDSIMSAGYSVSLFTDWRSKNIDEVWIKSRTDDDRAAGYGAGFFGAARADRDLHPISQMPAENCTPQRGVPGPWHERLPHFRMGFTPSSGKELQSEYFVPREHAYAALMAVGQLHEKISAHLLVSEIRCIAADDLWMSPCYQRDCTAIHFTWQPDWQAVSRLLPLIEEQLAPYHVRPHWGKLFTMTPARIHAAYSQLPAFRKLLEKYDPKGMFRNEFLDRNIFG